MTHLARETGPQQPRRLAVIGAGYVGLTAAACFAALGHHVTCVDSDRHKLAGLRRGQLGNCEPGIGELVASGRATGRLAFELSPTAAVSAAEAVFLCVPTPRAANGAADLSIVESVVCELRGSLQSGCMLVIKSTVPVGTAERVASLLHRPDVAVVSNPEFLREGSAVEDFFHPERVVVGSDQEVAARWVAALYRALGAPTLLTDAASAELVKYVSNCFLAVKLSYVNTVSELCERYGANVDDVLDGMGRDSRIGSAFLHPGPGWGGSCLPKDAHALEWMAHHAGVQFPLLRAAIDTNNWQISRMAAKIRSAAGGRLDGAQVAFFGLTFKAGTNDIRDSPALAVARELSAPGIEIRVYDPQVRQEVPGLLVVHDPYEAAKDVVVLVLLTEWPEFLSLDWERLAALMKEPVVVDARNHLDPGVLTRAGMTCHRLGRP